MERLDRGDESMFEGFRPEIVQEDIGHINLTDLNHTHGDDAHQDEPCLIWIQLQKACQKPHGKESNNRPEKDLEDGKDIPLCDDPILKHEGPYLNQSPLQRQ